MKKINNYEDYYITKDGKVFSDKHKERRQMKTYFDSNNKYEYIKLCKHNKTRAFSVHRLVAEHFIPNPHGFKIVHHIDGDVKNNDASNLMWTTQQNNVRESYKTMGPIRNFIKVDLLVDGKMVQSFDTKTHAVEYAELMYAISKTSLMKYLKSNNCELRVKCND